MFTSQKKKLYKEILDINITNYEIQQINILKKIFV